MTTRRQAIGALLAVLSLSGLAHAGAGADRLIEDLRKRFPKTEFTAVHDTAIPEIYEVWIVGADRKLSHE